MDSTSCKESEAHDSQSSVDSPFLHSSQVTRRYPATPAYSEETAWELQTPFELEARSDAEARLKNASLAADYAQSAEALGQPESRESGAMAMQEPQPAETFEVDPYAGIRAAIAPEHAELPANEITMILGRRPAAFVLHQTLSSSTPQQAALAALLGRGGRRWIQVNGTEMSVSAYLRLLSRLSHEVAEQSEAELEELQTFPSSEFEATPSDRTNPAHILVTPDQIAHLAPRALPDYRDAFAAGQNVLDMFQISENPLRVAHFVAQVMHESGALTIKSENLNYRAERLPEVWPTRFRPRGPLDPAQFAHKPQALGNEVYGGRMGNTEPGDGFRYRGRGLLQLTGKDSYAKATRILRRSFPDAPDFVANPDAVVSADWCLKVAAAEWASLGCNAKADADSVDQVTRAINGGLIGLRERRQWTNQTKSIWQHVGAFPISHPSIDSGTSTDSSAGAATRYSSSAAAMAVTQLTALAARSEIAHYHWKDRGRAPAGYIKGMAVAYARVYCKLKGGDHAAVEMAKADTRDAHHDALSWYSDVFHNAGMDNSNDGVDTLRHLFVLLTGVGMRESSGKFCEGRDTSASNTTADTAEAGLFQASFNAHGASPLMTLLFHQYAGSTDFQEIFREGVSCSNANLTNFGIGDGAEYQRLAKACPVFAVEFAAVGMRKIRRHWGTINRKEAEVRPECDDLLQKVQSYVDQLRLTAI